MKLYPDKWVVVEDATLCLDNTIKSGYLIGVCDDLEIDDFVVSCYDEDKNIDYARTVLGSFASALFFNH